MRYLALLLLPVSILVTGKTLEMGISASQIPPIAFIYLNDKGLQLGDKGILKQLGEAIEQGSDVNIKYRLIERSKVDQVLTNSSIDFICYVHPTWLKTSREHVVFSKPFLNDQNIVITMNSFESEIRKEQDFAGVSLGLIQGYIYPELESGIQEGWIQPTYYRREINAFKNLFLNKDLDAIVLKTNTIEHFMETMPTVVGKKRIKQHSFPMDTKHVSCAIPKKYREYLSIVNKGIDNFLQTHSLPK